MSGLADEPVGAGIDTLVEAYEEAQERDGDARVADFLPAADHPLFLDALCELVRVDLEYGWMRGQPRRLEDYRSEFPALFRDPRMLRQIAFEEWRLRRQAGESPKVEEYRERFGLVDFAPAPTEGLRHHEPGRADGQGLVLADDLSAAARLYRRHRREAPIRLAAALDFYLGPREHSELFLSLHESDPDTAERVSQGLLALPTIGSEVAGFRLERELGRGAFGRVYLARQGELSDRLVALKIAAELPGEAQTLALLQHTHIVPVYSAHRIGPLRAVCMPFFGATTLADVLRDFRDRGSLPDSGARLVESLLARRSDTEARPLPEGETAREPAPPSTSALQTLGGLDYVPAALWIGSRLADGLAHAHERGILHRDLKPANILMTDDGQPMLLDFNLAADTRNRCAAAMALIGGTLPYMAPEVLAALRGAAPPPDARSDLYSLGVILFELLTGRHPFPIRSGPLDEVLPPMIADREGPPPHLRSHNPDVSPATESIVRRCLEPDPARRYRDARQLEDDLRCQLEHRPLRHAPDRSPRERASKWLRRHPRLSSATMLGLAAALVIVGLLAFFGYRQRQFGPVEAAHALQQLINAQEVALVHLLNPAASPARRDEGIAACRRALAPYGVLESPDWEQSRLVRDLPAARRDELRSRIGELLMLWARALARQAANRPPAQSVGPIRDARRLNALAESCFEPGAAPRVLWVQRAGLARLAGDEAQANQARAQAAKVPFRSAREYALLAVDDPEGAVAREALTALTEASRQEPQDFSLWMTLGQYHAFQGRDAEAEDCFTAAVVLRPRSPWPYFHRGRVELERQEYEPARRDFDEALRLRPMLAVAYVNRALARSGLGDDIGAVADLTAALERGVPDTRIYFLRSEALDRLGDHVGADRDRAEGLRRTPNDAASWVARGLARLPADPAGALTDFEAALKLDPRSRSALQNRAMVLSEYLGRTEEAIATLDRVVTLDPGFVPARVGRGVLLARLGRRQEAIRDAEASLRGDTAAETIYRVACIYALTSRLAPDDRPRAFGMLATALSQESSWAEVARTDPDLDPIRDQSSFRELLRAFADRSRPAG